MQLILKSIFVLLLALAVFAGVRMYKTGKSFSELFLGSSQVSADCKGLLVGNLASPDFPSVSPNFQLRRTCLSGTPWVERYDQDQKIEFVSEDTGSNSLFRTLGSGVVRIDMIVPDPVNEQRFGIASCSGFFVRDDAIVTARHCISSSAYTPELIEKIRIVGNYYTRSVHQTVELMPEDYSLVIGGEEAADDFAIIVLKEPTKLQSVEFGVLDTGERQDLSNSNLFLLHHPLAKPLHLSQSACVYRSVTSDGRNWYNCSSYPISSGSPVFSRSSGLVVGVHVTGDPDKDGGNDASFISIASVLEKLPLLASDAQQFRLPDTFPEAPALEKEDQLDGIFDEGGVVDEIVAEDRSTTQSNEMSAYILRVVEDLAETKSGGGYGISDYFTEDLSYAGETLRGRNSPSTMCVAAITEVLVRAIELWSEETGEDIAHTKLPAKTWRSKSHKGLWPWLFHWDLGQTIPSYGRNFATGARDAFVLFGIGRSVEFADATPGDVIYFNRTGGSGHAVIFLGFLGEDYEKLDEFSDEVLGFEYFSAQSSGVSGLGYRGAYFDGYCPDNHGEELRRDCTIIRSTDPKLLSVGRLNSPAEWMTFDASVHIDDLLENGATLEEIEARRYESTRSLGDIQRALEADQLFEEELTTGPAFLFTGETAEE